MLKEAIEASEREERERMAKLQAENQLNSQLEGQSAAEAEIQKQRKQLEEKERQL